MKRLLSLMIILTLILGLTSCGSKGNSNSETGYEIGDLAYDIEIEDINGEVVNLSDFRGKKVYILAWTSTWGACLSEFPEIREVRESINPDEVELLIVNLTLFDNIKSARMAITTESLDSIAYFDVNGQLGSEYNIVGIPAAFYVNSQGIIKNISYGAETASDILLKIEEISD